MSYHEIQDMMLVRQRLSDLQAFLNSGKILEAKEVGDYLQQVIQGGIFPGIAEFNIKQWKEVNKVTTEYHEFDVNCQTALDYLSEPSNFPT